MASLCQLEGNTVLLELSWMNKISLLQGSVYSSLGSKNVAPARMAMPVSSLVSLHVKSFDVFPLAALCAWSSGA